MSYITKKKMQIRLIKKRKLRILLLLALSLLGIPSSICHLHSICSLQSGAKNTTWAGDLQPVELMANGDLCLIQPKFKSILENDVFETLHLGCGSNYNIIIAFFRCLLQLS